ncbi:hypothetical protein Ahy_A04g019184 isoform B [Arachis hypogaea]|uniref:Uncharacterized protein n=1 Tax=Arachis hypogaea TaxID=3818 RepID=A0A445DFK3_ARAHY|nr:hypothetical protein Ahy_A04g019184 isoform B [Arachis hypogaea]
MQLVVHVEVLESFFDQMLNKQGCLVKNTRNKRNQKKQCSSKAVNEGGGVKGPATTLTNQCLPKGRLHLIQAIGRQKRVA